MTAWILALMIALQPAAPWRSSYDATAQAIADVTRDEAPLFAGADGRARTAAVLVSVAWFESTFKPGATGDHGRSHGLFQVQGHGTLDDPHDATRAALVELRASLHVCRKRPLAERLAFYAGGGPAPHDADGCPVNAEAVNASKHRLARAFWLFKRYPAPNE